MTICVTCKECGRYSEHVFRKPDAVVEADGSVAPRFPNWQRHYSIGSTWIWLQMKQGVAKPDFVAFRREHGHALHEHPEWLATLAAFDASKVELRKSQKAWCEAYPLATEAAYQARRCRHEAHKVYVVLSSSSIPRLGKRAAVRRLHRDDLVREMAGMLL